MIEPLTIEKTIHFRRQGPRHVIQEGAPPPPPAAPVPRIARLMALALRFDGLVRSGQVKNYAQLARLTGVTRTRVTHIMSLLNLAADIQEELLAMRRSSTVNLKTLQPLTRIASWAQQRQVWGRLKWRQTRDP